METYTSPSRASIFLYRIYRLKVGPHCTRVDVIELSLWHDDVIKWKHFPRYWPFVRGIHRSPVNSPHKGQWRGALMFTLICARIKGWVNNCKAGDLRRNHAHYDVIVMGMKNMATVPCSTILFIIMIFGKNIQALKWYHETQIHGKLLIPNKACKYMKSKPCHIYVWVTPMQHYCWLIEDIYFCFALAVKHV